jgi:hypothetical protein
MIEPDTKDWTWVISLPCPECGFDGSAVSHTEVADRIWADAEEWPRRLRAPDVTVRPRPSVWSALEYGCHIRDVHRILTTASASCSARMRRALPTGTRTRRR